LNKSESIKELAAALSKAQGEIKGALKDQANPYFKSRYADLGSVVEAIKAPLSKNGLSYTQLTEPSERDEVRVETVIMHSSGEWISSVLALPVSKVDAQGFGSALTYARRYGLSAAFGVAPEDDDGNAAAKAAPEPVARLANANVTPAGGTREQLAPEVLKRVETCASEVIDVFEGGYPPDQGLSIIDGYDFGADEKAALTTYLDSKMRTALRKAREAQKKTQMMELAGSQA
jgi:hypothetical protein